MLLTIWTFSYREATPFILMVNFKSLFIEKWLLSLCTSLFALSIKNIRSRTLFGANWSVMCIIIQRRKFSKNSEIDFFIDYAIVGLRNMFSPNYSNTSHIPKEMNFSTKNSHFLLFVNHLLSRKQKGGSYWKERQHSVFYKGTATSNPLISTPCDSIFLIATSNKTTTQVDMRIPGHQREHFNWRFKFFSSSYLTLLY